MVGSAIRATSRRMSSGWQGPHLKKREGIHSVKDKSCCAVWTSELQKRAESLCCGIANGSILVAGACQLQCESLQDIEATCAVRLQA